MLKNLKNKGTKKQNKKQTKDKKNDTEQPKEDQETGQEELVNLVDETELKPEQGKVKQIGKKKNQYELQQKQIDVSKIQLTTVQKPVERTTWVANSVQQVNKKQFKMENVDHQFMSLTDQQFNQKQKQKILQKQKQQEEKQKVIQQNGLRQIPFQKSPDQIRMQKAQQSFQFKSSTAVTGKIGDSAAAPAINFTNSSVGNNFAPLQKTAQQLKMQEAEKKQEVQASKKATNSWIGSKKNNSIQADQKPAAFKVSAWVTMAQQNMGNNVGQSVKLAPLNETKKQPIKEQPVKTNQTKQTGWAASNFQQQNGIKFAPLQMSKQQQRMRQAERKEQQFVFVSKKQQQERRKKKQLLDQQKGLEKEKKKPEEQW